MGKMTAIYFEELTRQLSKNTKRTATNLKKKVRLLAGI
jgi:hypothetical protein